MRLQGIRAGDLVLCDIKGRRFHARVTGTPDGGDLEILPLAPAVSYRHASARSVIEHWRKAGRRTHPTADGDEDGDELGQGREGCEREEKLTASGIQITLC